MGAHEHLNFQLMTVRFIEAVDEVIFFHNSVTDCFRVAFNGL